MPSQALQDVIDTLRGQQKAAASQPSPTMEQRRAAFAPAGRLHPLPDDVVVTDVTAGGVPAHWRAAPGTDTGRVLLFLHDGGYEFGSLRSDGELAARLGRASGMRVLFPEYRLAPEHPFPAAIDDVLTAWHWLRTEQDLPAASMAVAATPSAWPPPQPEPEFTSPCTSATACPTSTRSWPAPLKPPRPPSRAGTSSGPGSANQTAQVNDMRTIAGSKWPVNVRGVMAPVQESAP